jgi:hypothetical protein
MTDIHIVDIDNFNIDNITTPKKITNININKQKLSIGYNNKDFYLITPFFINYNDYHNSKIQYLKLSFDPLYGEILKFYETILLIEQKSKDILSKYYSLNSIIKTENINGFDLFDIDVFENIKYMYIKLNNHYKIYSDLHETNIDYLKQKWYFKCLIKIDSFWIDINKKTYGLSIDLIQIKISQPIYQIRCLIDNKELANPISISVQIPEQKSSIAYHITETTNKKEIKSVFIPPNPMDLLNIKNALKSIPK